MPVGSRAACGGLHRGCERNRIPSLLAELSHNNSSHMPEIIYTIREMQEFADRARMAGQRIGLVPTMGFLHAGHLSLVRQARADADVVVVSVFVNPTQFGQGEDFKEYPRDLDRDCELLDEVGAQVVFAPSVEEMYPPNYQTHVSVVGLTQSLCGPFRPGHFQGVTTVVTKLLASTKPHFAVFGQKDAQQAIVIRRMVRDLNFDVDIRVAPTVREKDGLAMSSRNTYLSRQERAQATVLYESLQQAEALVKGRERKAERIVRSMRKLIEAKPSARIDYVSIVNAEDLQPVDRLCGEVLIAVAVWIGKARLIDNIQLKV